jgi:hypothetical protein
MYVARQLDALYGMFPFIDRQVILDVLEANGGDYEATVDCLLDLDYPKSEVPIASTPNMSDYELAVLIQQQLYNESIPKGEEVSHILNQFSQRNIGETANNPNQLSYISEVLGSMGYNAKTKLLELFQTTSPIETHPERSVDTEVGLDSEEVISSQPKPIQQFTTQANIRKRKPCRDPHEDYL